MIINSFEIKPLEVLMIDDSDSLELNEGEDEQELRTEQPKKKRKTNKSTQAETTEEMSNQIISALADFDKTLQGHSESHTNLNKIKYVGLIESIELIDFMCHRHLTLKLHPKVNFITGNNGSGKSAILTALVIAFGSKAAFTQRGNSVKSLIREGATQATVIIRLKNTPPNCFEHDKYGDKITVEKVIRVNSNAAIKIRNINGNILSTKKADIDRISDYFGIKVDNPLTILTQETSKKFLASSSPKDKYSATSLEELTISYDFIMTKINELDKIIADMRLKWRAMTEEIRKLQDQLDNIEKSRSLFEALRNLKKELAWSYVAEKEEQLNAILSRKEESQQKFIELGANISEIKSQIEEMALKLESCDSDIFSLNNKLEPLLNIKSDLEKGVEAVQAEIRQLKLEQKEINQQVSRVKSELLRNEEKAKEQLEKSFASSKVQIEEEIQALTNELILLNEEHANLKSQKISLEDQRSEIPEKLNAAKALLEKAEAKAAKALEFIQHCDRTEQNNILIYGENIQSVLADIDQSTFISSAPVGPVGRFISLKDKKWVEVMNSSIGSIMNAFVVFNEKDKNTLQRIFDRNRHNASIYVAPKRFQRSIDEPDECYLTILRALDIKSDAVKMLLIWDRAIEKILLFEDRKAAANVITSRPPHVLHAFTINAARLTANQDGRGYSYMNMNKGNVKQKYFTDLLTQRKSADQSLEMAKREIHQYVSDIEKFSTELNELDLKIQIVKTQLRNLEDNEIFQRHSRIRTLKYELEAIASFDMSVFEQEKQKLEEQKSLLLGQFQDSVITLNEKEKSCEPIKVKLNEIQNDLQEIYQMLHQTKEVKNRLIEKRQEIHRLLNHVEAKENAEKDRHNSIEEQGNLKQKEVENEAAKAILICPRVPVTKPSHQLIEDVTIYTAKVNERRRQQGDPVEILARSKAVVAEYEESRKNVAHLELLREKVREAVFYRQKRLLEMRAYIASTSSVQFGNLLSYRGMAGNLKYDHEKQELYIQVNTGNGTESTDVCALSGGERSFGTMALLLSLWYSVASPVRLLDEFDVFMDPVNRAIIIDLMVDFAKKTNVQYVFISPQNRNNIPKGPEISIWTLKDPERSQTTIN